MPSTKDPVVVVQPGPGRAPDGTVTATALTFPISAGSNAALQAHITDPIDAHLSSAIGTPAFGGANPRATPAGSSSTAFIDVYNALNSQAVWVLDPAGNADNSDFFGASCLITAMAQILLGVRKILYLRPGVYTWDDSALFDGVTVIGGPGTAEIRNLGGSLRLGADATFKNILINISGNLTFEPVAGRNTLENVLLDVDGVVSVQSDYNSLVRVIRTGSPIHINVTGAHNQFTQVNVSQLADSNSAGNSYRDLILDGPPRDSTLSVLSLTSSHSSLDKVLIAPIGAFTAPIVTISGSFNSISGLRLTSVTSSVGLVSVTGNASEVSQLSFDSLTNINVPMLTLGGTNVSIRDVRITTTTVAAASSGFRFIQMGGTNCHLDGFSATNLPTMGATSAVFNFSTATVGATIENVVLDTIGATVPLVGALVALPTAIMNSRNTFRNWTISNVSRGAGTIRMFDCVRQFTDGAIFDNISMTGCSSTAGPVDYFYFTGLGSKDLQCVTIKNCKVFSNIVDAHRAVVCVSTDGMLDVSDCDFQTSTVGGVVFLDNSIGVSFARCLISGPKAVSADRVGASFTNCIFKSVTVGGISGTQLFAGCGVFATLLGNGYNASQPLVIRNCEMQLSPANNDATSTTVPNIFLGGTGTSATTNHGSVIVDGLVIWRNPDDTFSNWHRSPVLTIDVANQSTRVQSVFRHITVNLDNVPFTGDANGSSVFGDITPSGTIVEIHGPGTEPVSNKTLFQGLSIVRVPRQAGAGNRAVLKAMGVTIENFTIDAANGTAGNYNTPPVQLNNCTLREADFYSTASLPVGTAGLLPHLYAESGSWCERIKMSNFQVGPFEATGIVYLESSALVDSFLHMPVGSSLASLSPMISASGPDCWVSNNKITYFHNAISSSDVRIVLEITSSGAQVINNIMSNLAIALAGGFSPTPAISNGGGLRCRLVADRISFVGNRMNFEWANDINSQPSITIDGYKNSVLGNFTRNTAPTTFNSGGTNSITVDSGQYNNVSNNVVEATNTNATGYVQVNTSAGTSGIVMGNRVDNTTGNDGEVIISGSDKPTPASAFNQVG